MGAISPGQIAFNFPDHHYGSHEKYLEALGEALRHEYKAITDAGFNLQIDSPDLAMAAHCRSVGSSIQSWDTHLPMAIDALNAALDGIPAEQVRLHVCWGNYAGPHHKDVPLRDIIEPVLKANAGTFYVEGANPRHEHEWEVFKEVGLPDGKDLILGVIDVKVNAVEHPRLVAQRLTRLRRGRRARERPGRHRLRLRHVHPLLTGRSRRRVAEAAGAVRGRRDGVEGALGLARHSSSQPPSTARLTPLTPRFSSRNTRRARSRPSSPGGRSACAS